MLSKELRALIEELRALCDNTVEVIHGDLKADAVYCVDVRDALDRAERNAR